jgi:D-alanyl-D-alanine dipeptidase
MPHVTSGTGSTTHDYAGRLDRASETVATRGLDGLIVGVGPDLEYLVGYAAPALERLTALIVRPGSAPALIVPELERPRALEAPGAGLVEMVSWVDGDDPYERAVKLFGTSAARLAAGNKLWAAHLLELQTLLPETAFEVAGPVLAELRAVKDAGEIDFLTRAGAAADAAFGDIVAEGLAGRGEREVAASLAAHLVKRGHETADFAIVASGPNGASPHHEPGGRTIQMGDVVVLDFGGRLGGYCSDITRTVSVGEPSEETRTVHGIVRDAQQAAFEAVGKGVTGEQADRAARDVIERAGYGEAFVHRTGHGIGLDVHEDPYLVSGNDRVLVPGNCFSIEPGIYLEGRFGVRIEDIVAITEDGPRRLNEATRDLVIVD